MPLGDATKDKLRLVRNISAGDCYQVPEQVFEKLCTRAPALRAQTAVPDFSRSGVYHLHIADKAELGRPESFGHHIAVVVVDGEALILQAWAERYTLTDWLSTGEEIGEIFQAARNNYSPTGAAYVANFARKFEDFKAALERLLRAWAASDSTEVEDMFRAISGIGDRGASLDRIRLFTAVKLPLKFEVAFQQFTGEPDVALDVPAFAPARRGSTHQKCGCIVM